ncbi:outer membrane beta-barrel protein [Negadavirga shengliensis]|uniref:Outer membrane beta-barrel protein n=1 Tax=Negadavirga shengliensis TaxID=1389218 RepID=A0ABV9SYB8_9BACT
MKEQFDKRLVEKIKSSFDHHEEPFDPREWEKLSKAYFKPKRKGWVAFWPFVTAGIAASLLLVLVYFPKQDDIENHLRSLSDSLSLEKTPTITEAERDSFEKSKEIQNDSGQRVEGERNVAAVSPVDKPSSDVEEITGALSRVADGVPVAETGDTPSVVDMASLDASIEKIAQESEQDLLALTDDTKEQSEAGLLERKEGSSSMEETEAQSVIDQWKAENQADVFSGSENESRSESLKLGLMVSPQANSNPVSGMNLGAGIMSEFSLSRKLKLDVGIAYARQNLNPQNIQQVRTTLMADAMTNSNFIASSYELNFASLDIPVNLKYKVLEKDKTGLYLITGLSSMVYLDQKTVETVQTNSLFRTNTAAGGLEFAQSVQEFSNVVTPQSGENSADLAGMLNLSFGYEYKLNNELFISFEPFYKLPLGNLTFVNQQFSIGGLNLRMNFNLKK